MIVSVHERGAKASIQRASRETARVVFNAFEHDFTNALNKVGSVLDKTSRLRITIKPTEQEVYQRRQEKLRAIQPHLDKIPLHDVEVLLDIDEMPIFDKYGNQYPSLRESRLHSEAVSRRLDKRIEEVANSPRK